MGTCVVANCITAHLYNARMHMFVDVCTHKKFMYAREAKARPMHQRHFWITTISGLLRWSSCTLGVLRAVCCGAFQVEPTGSRGALAAHLDFFDHRAPVEWVFQRSLNLKPMEEHRLGPIIPIQVESNASPTWEGKLISSSSGHDLEAQ